MQRIIQTSLHLGLNNKPGQLLAAIEPVSQSGANIISISHQRAEKAADGDLIVDIVISLPEQNHPKLIGALKANGVFIGRIGTEHLTCTKTFILIGHILHTDLTGTVNRIDKKNIAEITELHILMLSIDEPSTAKFTIKAVNETEMENAEEKHLMIIDESGGDNE